MTFEKNSDEGNGQGSAGQDRVDRAAGSDMPLLFGSAAEPRSVPANPLDRPTFDLFHIAIARGQFQGNVRRRPRVTPPANLRMVEVTDPTSDDFLWRLQKVGSRYGWDRRNKYQAANKLAIDEMMAKPGTRLFLFYVDGQEAGFCLVTPIDDKPGLDNSYRQGKPKTELVQNFIEKFELDNQSTAAEINKFGLYDEFTGKGYGPHFLRKVLASLFRDGQEVDIVYLDTRDTNHSGVVKFYTDNGMHLFDQETLKSDLIAEDLKTTYEPAPIDSRRVFGLNGGGGPGDVDLHPQGP